LKSLGRAAKSAGASFAPIGYDWRRDITASVRHLDVELRRDHPGRSLILVGHSMGGLVAWQWAAQHGRGADGGPRARHLVLVGSPVAGSCEMFRVLSDGYTAPTVHPDYATAFGRLMKPITDTALKWFTTDALAAAYTFPSVFELLPAVPDEALEGCVPVPRRDGEVVRRERGDYYVPAFWSAPFGQTVLTPAVVARYRAAGIDPVRRLEAVLDVAARFRRSLRVDALDVPVALYSSEVFNTPVQADVHADFRVDWTKHQRYGDGRVEWTSAVALRHGRRHVEWYRELLSVHGDLTSDERFEKHFVNGRLPALVQANVVLTAMRRLLEVPGLVDAARRARLAPVSWEVLEAARSGRSLTPDQRDADVVADQQLVDRFVRAVTAPAGDVVARVDAARRAQDAAGRDPDANARVAAPLGVAARDLARTDLLGDVGDLKKTAAYGRLGSALTFAGYPAAAIGPLRNAQARLAALPPEIRARYPSDVQRIDAAVTGNLGIALFKSGACEDAEPILREALALGNRYAAGYLRQPCRDGVTGTEKLPLPPD
jgi:pimeloyl-ACP methyl ester carboxylesterase